jgi:hypothetical protein
MRLKVFLLLLMSKMRNDLDVGKKHGDTDPLTLRHKATGTNPRTELPFDPNENEPHMQRRTTIKK